MPKYPHVRYLALALLPLLPACSNAPPPALTYERAVLVPLDRVGACLGSAFAPDYRTQYQPVPAERRAQLFVYRPATAAQPNPAPLVIQMRTGTVDTLVGFDYPPDGTSPVTERAKQAIVRCGETS
jgi:hypothetical protein